MKILKKKSPTQVDHIKILVGRLRGLDKELAYVGEPMLSMRFAALLNELECVAKDYSK